MYVHGSGRTMPHRSGMTRFLWVLAIPLLSAPSLPAQNVVTQHYDIARTGANTSETLLTPANVHTTTFGKLFDYLVDGYVFAQPLYVAGVTMGSGTPQAGTKHNVVFIATEHDSVYALDADGNLGTNAKPLWQITLLDAAHGAAAGAIPMPASDLNSTDITPEIGITSTPVIDPVSKTIYVVGKTKENGTYVQRLHALDITTGAEKFGGPKVISAAVPGNGASSSGGTLSFDPKWQLQRPGLLLLNGIVYIGFGAHQDFNIWHGWILAYNASTLAQTAAWCATPNGELGGVWMAGSGLAAEVPNPTTLPYGRMFVATGNGSYDTASPTFSYGDSVLRLDLANGKPVVGDFFTPHDQSTLDLNDTDQGSGGVLLLPAAVSGGKNLLIQAGKAGAVYVLNRDALGGYHPGTTADPEQKATVGGMWSMPAYWNGHVYFWGIKDGLKEFSIANGVLSTSPTSTGAEVSAFPGSVPAVSANGTTNGVVWNIRTDNYATQGREILYAHDATNVATLLYSSEQNVPRDNPGNAVKFTVPTVINGKLYLGAEYQVSVYGLLNGLTQAAAPVFNPSSENFNPSATVAIADSSAGAQIFYTTDGSTPTTASNVYTGPITVTKTQTIQAIAAGSSYLASLPTSATYTLLTRAATPTFSPSPAEYGSTQAVTIKTTTSGATIYYTLDGSIPTTSSAKYAGPISLATTTELNAIATAPGLTDSAVATGLYTIDQNGATAIQFGSGFSGGGMILAGAARLNGSALELTDGGRLEAAAAWFTAEANIGAFTNDFNFQITPGTSPTGDGFTFTLQASSASAIGPYGGGLGYGPSSTTGSPGIPKSVAIKFDLYSNAGEGTNSTGLYTNGASPTIPAVTLTAVNLHTTDVFHVHMVYDGTNLVMTITDTTTNATFTHTWPIDIPTTVGGPIAYVGFTAGTGGNTAVQKILNWTFSANSTGAAPAATPVISPSTGSYTSPQIVTISDSTSGSSIYYTLDGSQPTTSSPKYSGSFTVSTTTTIHAIATAPNFSTSVTATSEITIGQPAAATPVISPSSGSYSSPQPVTITDSTAGSSIFYTLDGSQPTASSTKYAGSFTVSASTTVNAIATAPNFSNSATATSLITIGQTAATPVISPATGSYTSPQTVTITDSTSGSSIFYTLDGSQPTASSTKYAGSFTISNTTTIHAIATAPNLSTSGTASSVITIPQSAAATPVIAPSTGSYSSPQTVTISDSTSGSSFFYTLDGSQPTPSSTKYSAPFTVSASTTINAIATAPNFTTSNTATSTITIQSGGTTAINFGSGFSASGLQFNGHTKINGTRLQLTDTATTFEVASAYWNTQVNVQTFTTDFTFQLTTPTADGFTFAIQDSAQTALGPAGGGLGFGPSTTTGTAGIPKSVAVKFDLYNNAGEGTNSTGMYTNGASPTVPATTLGGGVNLHSGDIFHVHMTYDGTTLTMAITDTTNTADTFTASWPINIPGTVGANTAYVGFTGATGGFTATQEILTWTYGN